MDDEPIRRTAPIQLLSKAAAILDLLAHHGERSAADIAVALNEPRPSVYRLLASLHSLELVEPGSRKGLHQLGIKIFQLGGAVHARFDERKVALPTMERIHEETAETVFLSIRRGSDAVCIERLEGKWVQSWAFRVGGVMPLHLGAGPRVLLAYQPRDVWLEYLSGRPLLRLTKHSATTPDELLPILEEIREQGYGYSDQDVVIGIAAVGAPIFDHNGTIRAALSMSGPRQSILDEQAEHNYRLISEGAAEISRLLGYSTKNALSAAPSTRPMAAR